MSENFAFIRNIDNMKNALKQIKTNKANFVNENKWKNIFEIGQIFKNYDIIKMQEIISKSMVFSAENYGSRGSAFVIDKGTFLDRNPVKENESGREKVLLARMQDGNVIVNDRQRKPIPTNRDLWFEKVWNEYKNIRNN